MTQPAVPFTGSVDVAQELPARLGRLAGSPRIVLALACLLLLLPFASKPLHIDDPMYVWAAEHIVREPLDPYGFLVNWGVTAVRMADEMKNPPLVCYYLAAAMTLLGRSEPALHAAMLLPAVGLILGTYQLAKELGARPVLAAGATLATPVFLLSATTIMCDVAMVCAYVWAVWFWVRGIRSGRARMLLVAAVLIAVSTLTKYFGVTLFPLLIAYGLLVKRRPGAWLLPLVVPVVILTAYHLWTRSLYGQGLLTDAAGFAAKQRWTAGGAVLASVLTGLAFTGGCCAAVAFLAGAAAWRTFSIVFAAAVVAAAALLLSFDPINDHSVRHLGATRWWFVAQLSFWSACGCAMFAVLAAHVWRERSADAALLGCWIAGTFCFAVFVNWNVAARSILPMAPAAAVLGALMWTRRDQRLARTRESMVPREGASAAGTDAGGTDAVSAGATGHAVWRPWLAVAPGGLLAVVVCMADASLARTHFDAANQVMAAIEPGGGAAPAARSVYFAGHWGFQHYMQQRGARPLDARWTRLAAGDVVVFPDNNAALNVALPPATVRLAAELELAPMPLVSTMRPHTDAGFYSDNWGPLPFAFGPVPAERYRILVIETPPTTRL